MAESVNVLYILPDRGKILINQFIDAVEYVLKIFKPLGQLLGIVIPFLLPTVRKWRNSRKEKREQQRAEQEANKVMRKNVEMLLNHMTEHNNALAAVQRELVTNGGTSLRDYISARFDSVEAHSRHLAALQRAKLQSSPEGFFEMDPAGLCIFVNRSLCAFYGLSEGDLKGKGLMLIVDPSERESISSQFYDAVEAQRVFFTQFVAKKGWIATCRAEPIRVHNTIDGWLGVITWRPE